MTAAPGSTRTPVATGEWRAYEIEAIPGIEEFVESELKTRLGSDVRLGGRPRDGRVSVDYRGDPGLLNALRSAVAVHLVETFEVPRPRALLGHEHLTRQLEAIRGVIQMHPPGVFRTFKLSAAGAESVVFHRLRDEISRALGLADTDSSEQADLLVSVRRWVGQSLGWQALVRLTPRPLSAREWRVCNLPGALNATVANAMVRMTEPSPSQRFLNIACGSGTLLIERLSLCPAHQAIGTDLSQEALDCARANLAASQFLTNLQLFRGDARHLPLAGASVDAITADLPYGMLVGPEPDLRAFYGAVVVEAARVAVESAVFTAITAHERWLIAALQGHSGYWETEHTVPIKVPFRSGSFDAVIFVLRRTARSDIPAPLPVLPLVVVRAPRIG